MADISKNRPISETKRHRVSILTIYYVYVLWGIYFTESIAEYIMPLNPPFWKPFRKHDGNVQRNSQKLRGVVPLISTLCLGFVGRILAEKVSCRMCQYQVSTILTFMAAIL